MANVQEGGFKPWGTFSGGQGVFPSPHIRPVANNIGTGIFKFDSLTTVSDGTVAASAAADNQKLLGVAIGFYAVTSGFGQVSGRKPVPFIPASHTFSPTTVGSPNEAWVEYIPFTGDTIFEVCADDATTVTTVAAGVNLIGENCDLATGSGDTTTGRSAMLLDISTHNTTTNNFRIIGIVSYPNTSGGGPAVGNDLTAIYAKYLVTCNEGFLPPYTTSGI